MKKAKKTLVTVICVLLALVIALTAAFFILKHLGFRGFHKDDTHIDNENVEVVDDKIITYNGQEYRLNENVINVLLIGVDKKSINKDSGIGKNGQADCIFLASIDTEKKIYKMIPVSREAMVEVETYSVSGMHTGVKKMQLCLAYAYGKTPEDCSENVMRAVKRMFYGININSYVTIDLDGFSELSTLVGGVTLTALENVDYDSIHLKGGQEVTLSGKTAIAYIRDRDNDLEANNRRMQRQKQFLSALVNKVGNSVMDNFTKLSDYYVAMRPYTSTNIDLSRLTYLASSCLTRDIGSALQYKSIEGSMSQGEYAEFNINEEQLLELVIDTFYEKVEKNNSK